MQSRPRTSILATIWALCCESSLGFSRPASGPSKLPVAITTTAPTTTEASSPHQHDSVVEPFGTALVDYSTATEFISEHYGIDHYFGKDVRLIQPVYDARNGVFPRRRSIISSGECLDRTLGLEPARLDDCGFELFTAPTQVQNFENLQQVQQYYVQELNDLIPKALGVTQDDIAELILWHPTMRGEELSVGSRSKERPGLGPIASRAHIDTDVGAYGLEGVCNLVDKNRVDALEESNSDDGGSSSSSSSISAISIKDDLLKACQEGRRMLLLNIWRPLVPVSSAPLGLLATHYDVGEYASHSVVFPNIAPSRDTSLWYIFSNMQPEECLIFKQFDRRLDKQSDIWHCALDVQEKACRIDEIDNREKRKSFDIKAMVILNEKVSSDLDRLEAAVPPAMTWEESGEFCDAQAQRLKSQSKSSSSSNG